MFREIRRNKKQVLSQEECLQIIEKATHGVMNVLGDDGYPYGVPLSYSFVDGVFYFHGALKGHKMDAIREYDKVSFTIVETDQIVPEEFTTYFRSVIVFGRAYELTEPEDKMKVLMSLVSKYSGDFMEGGKEEAEKLLKAVCIFAIKPEHISGKEAIEFANAKGK